VLFEGTGNVLQESANFFWDNTNSRLGIGTASPAYALDVATDIRALRLYTNIIRDSNANAYINNTVTNAATTDISIGNATAASITLTSKASGKFVFTTGNVLIGTTTDAGFKLDVNGTARVKGVGTTTGVSLSVQNSAGTDTLKVFDNGQIYMRQAGGSSLFLDRITAYSSTSISIVRFFVGSGSMSASADIQINSTTRGFLPPRMTTAQKNAIASPAEGLVVYDNNLNGLNFYNGNTWTNGNGVHSIVPLASGGVTFNGLTANIGNTSQTGLSIRLSPYIPAQSITTSNLYIRVTTATAGSLCTIVIYSDTDGVPTNLLYESADLDCSTTGLKTAITSFDFVAGTRYWLGLKTNGTTAARAGLTTASSIPLGGNAASTFISYQISGIPYASPAPNPIGTISLNASGGMIVFITKA
jgi:hypothetical protein